MTADNDHNPPRRTRSTSPRLDAYIDQQQEKVFPVPRRLLDVAGAAEHLTVSEHFVRRLVRERRIPVVKIGRHVRFRLEDLDAFVEQGRREARR